MEGLRKLWEGVKPELTLKKPVPCQCLGPVTWVRTVKLEIPVEPDPVPKPSASCLPFTESECGSVTRLLKACGLQGWRAWLRESVFSWPRGRWGVKSQRS